MQPRPILFETPHLIVRRVARDDAGPLVRIFGDPEAARYYGDGHAWNHDDTARFLARYPYDDPRLLSEPGIALDRGTGAVVGFGGVGYYRQDGAGAELFFILRRTWWGRGLASELAVGALAQAWQLPDLARVGATAHPDNAASARVLTKCGFVCDGPVPGKARLAYHCDRPLDDASPGHR